MDREELRARQLLPLLTASIAAPALSNGCAMMVDLAGRNAPALMLAVFALTALCVTLVLRLVRSSEYLAPADVLRRTCGRVAGTILLVALALAFLYGAALTLRVFGYIVSRIFMPQTPFLLLLVMLFLPVLYSGFCGLRVTGYIAGLLYPIVALFAVLFLLPKDNYHFSYIFPLWQGGVTEMLPLLPLLFFSAAGLCGLFFLLPRVRDREHALKPCLIFAAVGLVLFTGVYVLGVSFFGVEVLPQLVLPFDNLSSGRKGTFLERTDIIYLLLILPIMGITVCWFFRLFLLSVAPFGARFRGRAVVWLGSVACLAVAASCFYGDDIWRGIEMRNVLFLVALLLLLLVYAIFALKQRRRKRRCRT